MEDMKRVFNSLPEEAIRAERMDRWRKVEAGEGVRTLSLLFRSVLFRGGRWMGLGETAYYSWYDRFRI